MSVGEYLDALNIWIVDHKELVTVVAVPTLTWFVTQKVSSSAEKRARDERISAEKRASQERQVERSLAREMKLSEYRQKWIDDLRNEISEHQSICLASKLDLDQDLGMPKEKGYRLSELANRILLRINPGDTDYTALSVALASERLRMRGDDIPNPETLKVAQRILKREWERLKDDLTQIEQSKTS